MSRECETDTRLDAQFVERRPEISDGRRLRCVRQREVAVRDELRSEGVDAPDARRAGEADLLGVRRRRTGEVGGARHVGWVPVAGRLPLTVTGCARPIDRAWRRCARLLAVEERGDA